jgi:hypothetical protein
VEGIWSVLKHGMLANQAAASYARLVQVIRHSLQKIQRQPGLLDGCLDDPGPVALGIHAEAALFTGRRPGRRHGRQASKPEPFVHMMRVTGRGRPLDTVRRDGINWTSVSTYKR